MASKKINMEHPCCSGLLFFSVLFFYTNNLAAQKIVVKKAAAATKKPVGAVNKPAVKIFENQIKLNIKGFKVKRVGG